MDEVNETEMKGETSWLFFLDRNRCHAYVVALEEGPVRRAYALYREGRVLEAAEALSGATAFAYEVEEATWKRLYETVSGAAWRGNLLLKDEEVLDERPGEPALFLQGWKRRRDRMPVAVISQGGWKSEDEEPPELHCTLFVDKKLLEMGSIEGLGGCEKLSE